MKKNVFKVGARGSRLSLVQTAGALAFLRETFPGTDYSVLTVETPGDRDMTTPIERSAPDFFTRDLDDAVRSGAIDFAVHSAKDLPDPIPDGLDWFWLPGREDPRDGWVVSASAGKGIDTDALLRVRRKGARARIGVSSARRAAYARQVFPKARLLPLRGAIDARIRQLKDGAYDAVLMALAGVNRLYGGTPEGVDLVPISLDALTPPEAQGVLAVVFKAGDERLLRMREHFVKAVRFVSAGVGDAGLCTLAGQRDLAQADVILCDDLLGPTLCATAGAEGGPVRGRLVQVGKRCGAHTMKQPEITRLICDEARKGRRVVRLKGGDAGLFGRLAEETDALAALKIPFVVRPGVSALTAATTGTGLLLTRRGVSNGFTAFTPRSSGEERPLVLFMAVKVAVEEARKLAASGMPETTPCAFVFDAAGPREEIVRTTLAGCAHSAARIGKEDRPGLLIIGSAATLGWPKAGLFGGRRVLLTCSETVQARASTAVEDGGGRPIRWPLIKLCGTKKFEDLSGYDAVVLTSPSAVRIFFENCRCDRRCLPAFMTCGAGTDAELRRYGLTSDVMPARDFSAEGLIAEIAKWDLSGQRILRLRSAKAGPAVARALRKAGARVEDTVLYDNVFCAPGPKLPPFDDVFFASASAVASFLTQYGAGRLRGKGLFVMGRPTRAALPARLRAKAEILPGYVFAGALS